MISFLLLALLMAALTLLLLTRPLWWRSGAVAPAETAQPASSVASRLLLPALGVFVLVIAGTGYLWIGTPLALDPETHVAQDGPGITLQQIEAMSQQLEERVKKQPDDAEAWLMLGRSYAVLGRHPQALPAFRTAQQLTPNDPALLADYADALAMTQNRSLEGEPLKLVNQALAIDPNNLKALSLAGTAAFLRKDYAVALRHWEHLARIAPDDDYVRQIQGGIDEARRLAASGTPSTPTATPQAAQSTARTPADAARTSVSGTVALTPALAKQVSPEDTVFVFARAAEGPRMPLAILRKQVKDLPLQFTLDDDMAMSPAAKLSGAARVVVMARVSKSGNPMAQPGDLQGQSTPVAPGARGVAVEIGQVVGR